LVPESPVIAANQTLKLLVTVSTTTLHNSLLSVDFGDGSNITAALQPGVTATTNNTQDLSVPNDDRGLVRISCDNYRLTCQLRIEILHIYWYEGDYNVSVMARAEETLMAQNWTMIIVQSYIENVSILVDSVVTVQQNVTIEALMSPFSVFVKYHWTVLDITDRMNSSVVLFTSIDVPQVQLMSTDAGDYLVNVTVSNELSTASDSVIVSAAVPISTLLLSCNDDNKCLLINAKFDCIATVAAGTDVGFMWDFDVGNSIYTTSGGYSSVATVAFPAVGSYNITVTAWNQLSSETAWTTVDIATESVFKLITLASEAAVVGKPVSVMACLVHNVSNLTVEFDFIGGSHHLVIDTEQSRSVRASHIYLHPGTHTVTVKAETSIAAELIHLSVTVLDHLPDVDIKLLSALVTGRHSVFMAVFDGNLVCFVLMFYLFVF